jgi:glyoxylase-like metal-dependent hydrolase (beta-lactamase superfamily II)
VNGPACPVHDTLADGDVLPVGEGAVAIHTPGHTPGSIALFFRDLSTVLTGDVAAEFNGEVIAGAFHVDRQQVHQSVRALADTGATVAGFGHGEVVRERAADLLAAAGDPLA